MKTAFISDVHFPFEHSKLLNTSIDIIREEKVNTLVLGGDIIDFYTTSSFVIDKTAVFISQEIERTTEFLASLRRKFKGEIIYLSGNHEERIQKYILKRADVLAPLLKNKLSLTELLQLEKHKIQYCDKPFRIGKLYYLHGHEKRMTAQVVHAALNILRWLNRSFIAGHFHRFQMTLIKEVDKSLKGGWISGCLMDINKMPTPYEKIDTNQLGFTIIHYHNEFFFPQFVTFIPKGKNYICFYNNTTKNL